MIFAAWAVFSCFKLTDFLGGNTHVIPSPENIKNRKLSSPVTRLLKKRQKAIVVHRVTSFREKTFHKTSISNIQHIFCTSWHPLSYPVNIQNNLSSFEHFWIKKTSSQGKEDCNLSKKKKKFFNRRIFFQKLLKAEANRWVRMYNLQSAKRLCLGRNLTGDSTCPSTRDGEKFDLRRAAFIGQIECTDQSRDFLPILKSPVYISWLRSRTALDSETLVTLTTSDSKICFEQSGLSYIVCQILSLLYNYMDHVTKKKST